MGSLLEGTVRLIELLSRACPDGTKYNTGKAIGIVLRKWPHVRHFTDEQLQELKKDLQCS